MKRYLSQIFSISAKYFSSISIHAKMPRKRYFVNALANSNVINESLPTTDHIKAQTLYILQQIEKNCGPSVSSGEDGLYLGSSGISYMYYHLSKQPFFATEREKMLNMALVYLKPAINTCQTQTRRSDIPSFILGACGVYAIASAIYATVGDREKQQYYLKLCQDAVKICSPINFLDCGSDELFVGRAGYICGILWLVKEKIIKLPAEQIYTLCRTIVQSGVEYSRRTSSRCPLMYSYYNTEYLGAAHGLCSILQMIMSVPGFLESHPEDADLVKGSVDYMLSIQDSDGNFPCDTDEIRQNTHELVHWCHGAPGVIYLMAKAYLIWNDLKYLESCKKCASVIWKFGLLRKGPGLCHGVAGNAYAFLLMYRLTGDEKYIQKAKYFSQFMESEEFIRNARTPDNPFSLYEGLAGTACFLGDLMHPQTASFPFMDVFLM